jgi:hypothetical protein
MALRALKRFFIAMYTCNVQLQPAFFTKTLWTLLTLKLPYVVMYSAGMRRQAGTAAKTPRTLRALKLFSVQVNFY